MNKSWQLFICIFLLFISGSVIADTQLEDNLQGCACDSVEPPPPPDLPPANSEYDLGTPKELIDQKELRPQQPSNQKIARINLGMAVSLHPRMSLFNFQRMGFYKVEPGLSKEEFDSRVAELKANSRNPVLIKKDISNKNELQKLGEDLQSLFNHEKTIIPAQMSESGRIRYDGIVLRRSDLNKQQLDLEYELKFPEFTSPDKTRSILAEIENEILSSVRRVAKENDYSVVLNNSVPSPFGYPISYHPGTKFNTGPAGLDQALFYAFLHERTDSDEDTYLKDKRLKTWISMTSRPEAQDMLPIKPWPLVLEGGDCILEKVLKNVYDNYGVASTTWEHLAKLLSEIKTY